ncbi:MAG TPA: hypothetical protein VGE98_01745 [Thermoanaerobaculia bacterium]
MTIAAWLRRSSPRLLYLGVLVLALLVGLTSLSIYREWQRRVGQSRADALFQLVEGKRPARPTETPGATAWLNLELRKYRRSIDDPERARLYGEVADWQERSGVPPFLAPLAQLLARPLPATPLRGLRLLPPEALGDDRAGEPAGFAFRNQRYLEAGGRWLVLTRRATLDTSPATDPESPANRFLSVAAPHVAALAADLDRLLRRRPLPAVPGNRPPRVVRVYALSEDGTLLSAPFPQAPADPQGSRRAVLAEGNQFRKLPELPTLVSNEFYFQFDFTAPAGQSFYSGLYLDVGGQGLVATLTVPQRDPALGFQGIVGADLTFDIDWRAFARNLDAPLVAAAVTLPLADRPQGGQLWIELRKNLGRGEDPTLAGALGALAARGVGPLHTDSVPYVRHGVVAGQGAVAAFQVTASTWLVVLFPNTRSQLPVLPILLSALLLVLLLAGFEANRRRAEKARREAERVFDEKQNLLNTMQVPLVVVDPNTDEVVFRNQAAAALGIEAGSRIADRIAGDAALAHYQRMQVASALPRRAYGLPMRVRGDGGETEERYAVVRSVAVTAPIEALAADERHRLGILFLLEPDADLALLTGDLVSTTRDDERRRLAGLLTHGVDTLLRVLARCLEGRAELPVPAELTAWLAAYVDRRLRATAWLLAHWDEAPPLPPDAAVEPAHVRTTLDRLATVFAHAAADLDLRSRLHWDNGVLSAWSSGPAFTVELDWPDVYAFTCPVRGGFGFFLGEVLINAMQHGRPGSRPAVRIALDRVRKELLFSVENDLREDAAAAPDPPEAPYGGRRILRRLADLFEWRELTFERRDGTFRASWRVPVSERGDPWRGE